MIELTAIFLADRQLVGDLYLLGHELIGVVHRVEHAVHPEHLLREPGDQGNNQNDQGFHPLSLAKLRIAMLSKEELFARLTEGHAARMTVVTPNKRLSQELQQEFDAYQIAKNLTVWEAP